MQIVSILGQRKDFFKSDDNGVFSPTIALALNAKELGADSIRVLYKKEQSSHMKTISDVLAGVAPDISLVTEMLPEHNAFDPVEVGEALTDTASKWPQDEKYAFSLGTGTHVHMYLWFKLVEVGYVDAVMLQVINARKGDVSPAFFDNKTFIPGRVSVMDMSLSRYESIERRLMKKQVSHSAYLRNGIDTLNEKYNVLIEMIERVGVNSHHPLLLSGPSGSGKTALAKRIYDLKKQVGKVKGDWVSLNCATLTESHAMSVLFGHEKGAFTGALSKRLGLLASANEGVLFLDEIACLPSQVQSMLLHALDTGEYYPMGADTPRSSTFTLICGTNEDLNQCVDDGTFRDDLLARVDTWNFVLPGLSQRKEDIAPNLDFELQRFREESGRKVRFTAPAKKLYLSFACSAGATWRRNFRDLKSSFIRMSTLAESNLITENVVNDEIVRLTRQWAGKDNTTQGNLSLTVEQAKSTLSFLDGATLEMVARVCAKHARITDAARELYRMQDGSVSCTNPASRLNNYLNKLDLSFDDVKG